MIAGQIVQSLGFTALNISVALLSLAYCPALYYLRDMHDYKPFEGGTGEIGDGGGIAIGNNVSTTRYFYLLEEEKNMQN